MMLRLRPYHIKDAETILSWAKDEKAFINGQQAYWEHTRYRLSNFIP